MHWGLASVASLSLVAMAITGLQLSGALAPTNSVEGVPVFRGPWAALGLIDGIRIDWAIAKWAVAEVFVLQTLALASVVTGAFLFDVRARIRVDFASMV